MHILEIYMTTSDIGILYIYIYVKPIFHHTKGPEQDQLRSPFVPYVRNSAERSIHNFDSQPYIYITIYICIHASSLAGFGCACAFQ